MNSPKDFNEVLRDRLLRRYDWFLNHVEEVIGEKLPDATRMKNISNFSLNLKLIGDVNFQKELMKKFEVIKIAKKGFIDDAIKEKKAQIKSAEFFLIPAFYIQSMEYDTLYIVKKKDQLNNVKQGVKDFFDRFLPSPNFNHR